MRDALPALLAGLLAAAPALAQTAPNPPAPAATPAPTATRPDPAVERRIAALRSRLGITPSEEPQYRALAEVMRENARRMAALIATRKADAGSGNAVDQMQSYGRLAQAHVDDLQRLIPVFSDLYAALSPAQKKRADDSFRHYSLSLRS